MSNEHDTTGHDMHKPDIETAIIVGRNDNYLVINAVCVCGGDCFFNAAIHVPSMVMT